MIVRYESDGTVVMITQNDHAKLAGYFAAHWGNDRFERPRPWDAAVRAAHYHDSGWFRYETSPRFEEGRTPNYRQVSTDGTQLAAYQSGIDMLYGVDTYTGLLASKHRTGLWQSRYGVITEPAQRASRKFSPDIEAFIARNEAQQQSAAAGVDPHELDVNYNLVQVWDLLSLYICSNEHLQTHAIAPVPTGYARAGTTRIQLSLLSPGRIAVDPFPFDQGPLEIGVVHRRLAHNTFRDADEFRVAYFGAKPQIATFTLVG